MRLDPDAGEQGAVKLYIPTTTIPQDTAQMVQVFYVTESGSVDVFGLIVTERAGTFLVDLAAEAEPQVKTAYADVTQVNSDTYLEDTRDSIRADGVTPLPNVQPEKKGIFYREILAGGEYIVVDSSGKVILLNGGAVIVSQNPEEGWGTTDPSGYAEERQSWGETNISAEEKEDYSYDFSVDGIEYTISDGTSVLSPAPKLY